MGTKLREFLNSNTDKDISPEDAANAHKELEKIIIQYKSTLNLLKASGKMILNPQKQDKLDKLAEALLDKQRFSKKQAETFVNILEEFQTDLSKLVKTETDVQVNVGEVLKTYKGFLDNSKVDLGVQRELIADIQNFVKENNIKGKAAEDLKLYDTLKVNKLDLPKIMVLIDTIMATNSSLKFKDTLTGINKKLDYSVLTSSEIEKHLATQIKPGFNLKKMFLDNPGLSTGGLKKGAFESALSITGLGDLDQLFGLSDKLDSFSSAMGKKVIDSIKSKFSKSGKDEGNSTEKENLSQSKKIADNTTRMVTKLEEVDDTMEEVQAATLSLNKNLTSKSDIGKNNAVTSDLLNRISSSVNNNNKEDTGSSGGFMSEILGEIIGNRLLGGKRGAAGKVGRLGKLGNLFKAGSIGGLLGKLGGGKGLLRFGGQVLGKLAIPLTAITAGATEFFDKDNTNLSTANKIKKSAAVGGSSAAGAVVGGILGSFLGPIGTFVGGALGGVLGAKVGKFFSDKFIGTDGSPGFLRKIMNGVGSKIEGILNWLRDLPGVGKLVGPKTSNYDTSESGGGWSGGAGSQSKSLKKRQASVQGYINNAANLLGLDPTQLTQIAGIESGFSSTAKAGTSSATGLYQFTKGTWRQMVGMYGKKYGISEKDINDPKAQALMGGLLMKHNSSRISKVFGRKASNVELYLAHFLGDAGAIRFIKAMSKNPDGPAITGVAPSAVRANKSIFYEGSRPRTFREIYEMFSSRLAKYNVMSNEEIAKYGGSVQGGMAVANVPGNSNVPSPPPSRQTSAPAPVTTASLPQHNPTIVAQSPPIDKSRNIDCMELLVMNQMLFA